jgi:hypothetical protein
MQQLFACQSLAVLKRYFTRVMQRELKAYYSTSDLDGDRTALEASVTDEEIDEQNSDIVYGGGGVGRGGGIASRRGGGEQGAVLLGFPAWPR